MFYANTIKNVLAHGAILLLVWGIYSAQAFSQKAYNTVANTTSRAAKAFEEGIEASHSGRAAIAIGFLEKAVKADPKLIDARIALGDLYESQQNYDEAQKWYNSALQLDSFYAPHLLYYLARAEFYLKNFEAAAALAEQYVALPQANPSLASKAAFLRENALFVAHAYRNPVPFKPESLGPGVNTQYDEYFPSLTGDEKSLIFTRRAFRNEDFYMSQWEKSAWQKAAPVHDLNTSDNEGALAISPDGSWLTFTACNRKDEGAKGSCDLYWSLERDGAWTKPAPFGGAINTPYWESQPTIGADNRTIIFVSERPGGYGGKDLWITTRPIGGKWTKPENLGPGINTGGNEQAPFLHPDGQTLYFSSDSLPGMGGEDLYVSRRQADGTWGKPQNLGYPINTEGNEGMFIVGLSGQKGYFASNRLGGAGGMDIYSFELPEAARPQAVTYLKARITDARTGAPLVAALDIARLPEGALMLQAFAKSDGTVLACLPADKSYAVNINKEGYLFFSENVDLSEMRSAAAPILLDVRLIPIAKPKDQPAESAAPVVLRNIFFEFGSAILKPESYAELERLANLLHNAPDLRIQINGHTDNVGDSAANLRLSEARALAVKDFLIGKGIAADRLRHKGYGMQRPIADNDTPEGRARNRRTEFEMINAE